MSEHEPRRLPEIVIPTQDDLIDLREEMIGVYQELDTFYKKMRERGENPSRYHIFQTLFDTDTSGWKVCVENQDPLGFDEYAVAVNALYDSYAVFGVKRAQSSECGFLVDAYFLRKVHTEDGFQEIALSRGLMHRSAPYNFGYDALNCDAPTPLCEETQEQFDHFADSYTLQTNIVHAYGILAVASAVVSDH